MKTFRQFINERQYYHSVRNERDIKSIGNKLNPKSKIKNFKHDNPIWLAHHKHDAMDNQIEYSIDGHPAKTYRVKVKGKIAHHRDPKIEQLFNKHKIDQTEYDETLNGFYDDANHIKYHPATKMLQTHGYKGYHHPEEGFGNIDKYPTGSTVVFNRRNVSLHKSNKLNEWGFDPTTDAPFGRDLDYQTTNWPIDGKTWKLTKNGQTQFRKNGIFHRSGDRPAIIEKDGTKHWFVEGKRHREGDKPAWVHKSGEKKWYKNGVFHRDDGKPAHIKPTGKILYDADGKKLSVWHHHWYENGKRIKSARAVKEE